MKLPLAAIVFLFQAFASRLRRKTAKRVLRLPPTGYSDFEDALTRTLQPSPRAAPWTDYAGNECPFADVLHHSRYNLESLLAEYSSEYITEVLDLIRLEQGREGENHEESAAGIIKRALSKVLPYSSHPQVERDIDDELARDSKIYRE